MFLRAASAISVLCLVAVAAFALHAISATERDSFLQWRDPAVTAAGRVLYVAHCAACHGMPDGSPVAAASETSAPPHDATGHSWQHPDFALFRLVRDGIAVANCAPVDPERMPKFKGIVSDRELVAILSYIKSTWPEAVRRDHDEVNMMYAAYNRAVEELIDTDSAGAR